MPIVLCSVQDSFGQTEKIIYVDSENNQLNMRLMYIYKNKIISKVNKIFRVVAFTYEN